MCRIHDSTTVYEVWGGVQNSWLNYSVCRFKVKVTIKGHWTRDLNVYWVHHIYTWKDFKDVHLSEIVHRTHNSTMQTQGQGHSWRSWDWAFFHVCSIFSFMLRRILFNFGLMSRLGMSVTTQGGSGRQFVTGLWRLLTRAGRQVTGFRWQI